VDFLPALAAAVPPATPAPGKIAASIEAPAGIAASDFAALMSHADPRTGKLEQAMPAGGSSPSGGPVGSDSGDGAARERQLGLMAFDSEMPDGHADPVLRAAAEQAQTMADAIVEGMPSVVAAADQRAAAIGAEVSAAIRPEVAAAHERAQAKAADRPDPSEPEISLAEAESAPAQPILMSSPAQLLPSDAPAIEGGLRDPAPAPQPQAGAAAPTEDGASAPSPAATPGTGLAIAGQAPFQAPESAAAANDQDSAGAPAPPAKVSMTAPPSITSPSKEQRAAAGDDQMARAAGPERAAAPGKSADRDDQSLLQERPAAPDGPSGSHVRGSDPSAKQQPSSDVHPGRLSQASAPHGNAVATVHPTTGVAGEVAQAVARAPDAHAGAEPGSHRATQQVALHITKALDQDRTEIRIRLDPPELGEVDIQLEFRDLRLSASVSAERPDTLDLLQRDSRALARALRDAGLELADSDLSFAYNGRNDRPDGGSYAQRMINLPDPFPAAAPLQALSLALASPGGFVSLSDGRMDLRV
jgi:flagellar hook-length control protein FliK